MKKILFILFTALAVFANADMLLWLVNDNTTVDGGDIYTFLSPHIVDEDNWNAVRVKVSGGNLSSPIILPITFD